MKQSKPFFRFSPAQLLPNGQYVVMARLLMAELYENRYSIIGYTTP